MLRIIEVELADAGDVGADGNLVVRDALGCPHAADLLRTFAKDFEYPDFILVGYGEAFTAVAVAVLLDEAAHEPDGLPGCRTALQCDTLKLFDEEESLGVLQRVATADGSLAHGQLLLVEAGVSRVEESVGVPRLRNRAAFLHARHVFGVFGVHQSLIDAHDGVARIVLRGLDAHPGSVPGITRMARHNGAVDGCFLAHHDAGAGVSFCLCRAETSPAEQCQKCKISHYINVYFTTTVRLLFFWT